MTLQAEARAGENEGVPEIRFGNTQKARWYDPGSGTFLSVDPVVADAGDPQAYNAYAYARNNPVSNVDPTGMFSQEWCCWPPEAPAWGSGTGSGMGGFLSFAGGGGGVSTLSQGANGPTSVAAAVGDYASDMARGELLDVWGGISGTLNGIVTGFIRALGGAFTLNDRMLGEGLMDLGGALSMPRLGSHGGLRHPGSSAVLPESGTKPNNASIVTSHGHDPPETPLFSRA
jgi:RHS repeat-associated protein